MNDIMEIVKYLKKFGLLINVVSKTIENKAASLFAASLLGCWQVK